VKGHEYIYTLFLTHPHARAFWSQVWIMHKFTCLVLKFNFLLEGWEQQG